MPDTMPPPLAEFAKQLAEARNSRLPPGPFCDWARQQTALLSSLPAPFEAVLFNLLDRLESSALFSEESCSFSQTDLWDSLDMWTKKAQAKWQAQLELSTPKNSHTSPGLSIHTPHEHS